MRMERVLFIVAASVLCANSSLPERGYLFIPKFKNWTEAQSYCREKHVDLAVIHNMEDVKILNKINTNRQRAWIGLYNSISSWSWSMSDTDSSKHHEAGFTNWAPKMPNYAHGKVLCGHLHYNGAWYDAPCEWRQKSVCSDVKGSDVSFVLINTLMSWTAAQNYCREHHTDLASVRSMTENQKIQQMIPAAVSVWIGLFRHSWKWVDGRNFSFSYWSKADSDDAMDDCVAANLRDSGKWETMKCHDRRPFICYDEPFSRQVVRLKLARSSSVDLNDPAVQEDLLKQFKQKLKYQGVEGDITLNWRKQSDGKIFHKEEEEQKTSENDEL